MTLFPTLTADHWRAALQRKETNNVREQIKAMALEIWLIEELWTDSLENEPSAAFGYKPVGFVHTEQEADALIDNAGIYIGNCWAITKTTWNFRKIRLPRLIHPNHDDRNQNQES